MSLINFTNFELLDLRYIIVGKMDMDNMNSKVDTRIEISIFNIGKFGKILVCLIPYFWSMLLPSDLLLLKLFSPTIYMISVVLPFEIALEVCRLDVPLYNEAEDA